ncbi:TPA: hypothetical protein SAY52_005807 [Burkholderia cenocepacia]|uniref:hypothetical protein n=1 Tax=unclassified Burkholderia TaxID=2613784 RepID=UPI00158BE4CE|nr:MULTISPECIES: hypothetical protein [unclassified Burkholderia]HEF5875115.1 hypothetical protein [Burkholderia cenocepacia]
MTHANRERRLRRAIAELARCRIEDVESIWAMLSDVERERLRPLLADASQAVAGPAMSPAVAPDTDADRWASRLAHACAVLPIELAVRLAAELDDAERRRMLTYLPDERRRALANRVEVHPAGFRISPRAVGALRVAVLAIDATTDAEPPSPASTPRTLRTRLRNLVGGRR